MVLLAPLIEARDAGTPGRSVVYTRGEVRRAKIPREGAEMEELDCPVLRVLALGGGYIRCWVRDAHVQNANGVKLRYRVMRW